MPGSAQVSAAQRILTTAWTRQGLLAWVLWPVSWLYGLLVRLRKALYRVGLLASERLPVPVIVVGNVVAGGAGKTPVVMALVQHLQTQGVQVGVISRGYGRHSQACLQVRPDSLVGDVGDEPALIYRRTAAPVFVAAQRSQAAWALLAKHPQTQLIICDDGLQHLRLQRDLEIGVFDDRGVGNGFLLPAGPLREPWPRALDMLLHTGIKPAFAGFTARRALASHAVSADGQPVALTNLGPVLAVAAIAQPEAFFAMLRAQGVLLSDTLALPDHYDFNSWNSNEYVRYRVICTEKDAVKLWPKQADALAVPLDFSPEPAFWTTFDQRVKPLLQRYHHDHGHTTT
jgi:tetraacyldisaccharide 4'-kinase